MDLADYLTIPVCYLFIAAVQSSLSPECSAVKPVIHLLSALTHEDMSCILHIA